MVSQATKGHAFQQGRTDAVLADRPLDPDLPHLLVEGAAPPTGPLLDRRLHVVRWAAAVLLQTVPGGSLSIQFGPHLFPTVPEEASERISVNPGWSFSAPQRQKP